MQQDRKVECQVALVLFVVLLALLGSCFTKREIGIQPITTSLEELRFSVTEAPDYTNLFQRTTGWFGGDGVFTIPLNGVEQTRFDTVGSVLVLFSDSLIGQITDGKLDSPFVMINNSAAWMEAVWEDTTSISFHWATDIQGAPQSLFVPRTPNAIHGQYYWLGDGFTNQEKNYDTYLFGYRIITTGTDAFNFKEVGNALIVIPSGSKPPFADHRQLDTPFYFEGTAESTGSFGAGILVNTKEAGALRPDGYVYIYGVKGAKKEVMVARVKPRDIEVFHRWRFWDGMAWQDDFKKAAVIADRASNELSVTSLEDGRYALVFQKDGIAPTVGLRLSLSPEGPFGPIITVWDTSDDIRAGSQLISYNAKAHPSLSKPGELVISYNINSFDFFEDVKISPDFYRPRFIRVKFNE